MKPTVYIETTIVSYLTARPSRDIFRLSHEILTRDWWAKRRADFDLVTSVAVLAEAAAGDPTAAAERLKALDGIPILTAAEPAATLAEQLVVALSLPPRAHMDASHVAIAAYHGISFLLTWNCRHLANAALASRIERTCGNAGFTAPRIVTPELLMEAP